MKVKELIAELQKLNQEKSIWIYYDLCEMQVPLLTGIVDAETASKYEKVHKGDYYMEAW